MWIVPYTRRILSIMVTQRQTRSRDDLDVLTMVHFWWVRHTKKKTIASKIDFSATPKKIFSNFPNFGEWKFFFRLVFGKNGRWKIFYIGIFQLGAGLEQIRSPFCSPTALFGKFPWGNVFVSPSVCLLWRLQFLKPASPFQWNLGFSTPACLSNSALGACWQLGTLPNPSIKGLEKGFPPRKQGFGGELVL